jgi:hypothetical protein
MSAAPRTLIEQFTGLPVLLRNPLSAMLRSATIAGSQPTKI